MVTVGPAAGMPWFGLCVVCSQLLSFFLNSPHPQALLCIVVWAGQAIQASL